MRALLLSLSALLLTAAPAGAQSFDAPQRAALSDAELAEITGKFILPNGAELALTVTSDTVVNGQLILRTVLTVDHSAQVQVFGRGQGSVGASYTGASNMPTAAALTGVTVALDRQSGIQTVTPTYGVAAGTTVSVGAATQSPESLGLAALPLTPGGPAVATADGLVSLESVRNGSRVTFAGDQLGIINQVGQSVASAVINSANDRTIDTVTNISIDARNIAPYQLGMAQMRVDALAIEATRGLIR